MTLACLKAIAWLGRILGTVKVQLSEHGVCRGKEAVDVQTTSPYSLEGFDDNAPVRAMTI